VWQRIRASGARHHPAYDLGMPRLSCCFCIYSPRSALLLAGQHNPELLAEYVAVEKAIGHRFRLELSLAEVQDALAAGGITAQCREAASTRGVGAWIERVLLRFGDETSGRHHYNAHLSQGCTVLVIPVPDHASARRIADVLLQYGAYDVAYFSRWTVTPLNATAYDVVAEPIPARR